MLAQVVVKSYPRHLVSELLKASVSLLDRLEEAAGDHSLYLDEVRADQLAEGLPAFEDLASPLFPEGADSVAAGARHFDGKAVEFVEGLLLWAETIGFEYPARGLEVAGGAFYAASQVDDERITARALMTLAGWKRATGDTEGAAELLDTVMRRGVVLDDALSREFARLYAHLLTDTGELESARLSAGQGLLGPSEHEKALAAMALTYVCLQENSVEEALRWHVASLEQLSPAAGFPAGWQAALNSFHLLAELDELAPEDLDEAWRCYERLAAISPFGKVSAPALYETWVRGQLLFASGDAEAARTLLREVVPGFRKIGLERESLDAAGDLVLAETELGHTEAAASLAADVLEVYGVPRGVALTLGPKVPRSRVEVPLTYSTPLRCVKGQSFLTLVY